MAKRSGFYFDDGIVRVDVDLPWNLGFDSAAKKQYVANLHSLLGNNVTGLIADVTTASYSVYRDLSPVIRRLGDLSVDEKFSQLVADFSSKLFPLMTDVLFDLLYFKSFDDKAKRVIDRVFCFTDVFYNPSKAGSGTQALSLARYKKLLAEDKLDLTKDPEGYYKWISEEKIKILPSI